MDIIKSFSKLKFTIPFKGCRIYRIFIISFLETEISIRCLTNTSMSMKLNSREGLHSFLSSWNPARSLSVRTENVDWM